MPFVYFENFIDVNNYTSIFFFNGNDIDTLITTILDFIQANGECVPVVEVYSGRKGVAERVKLTEKIPTMLESVYVILK